MTHGRRKIRDMADHAADKITTEEERKILLYYQIKLLEMCSYLDVQVQVHSTAITYFKLFFQKKKVYHYNMRNLIAAFVFLAMKVENTRTTAEFFKERLSFIDVNKLVQYEAEICQEIKFNLHVSSPHLRLLGLYLLLKDKEARKECDSPIQTQEIAEDQSLAAAAPAQAAASCSWESAVENLNSIMLSERYLEFDINDVAMASLNISTSDLDGLFMEHTIENVKQIRKEMESIAIAIPNQEDLRRIDGKIKSIQAKYNIAV